MARTRSQQTASKPQEDQVEKDEIGPNGSEQQESRQDDASSTAIGQQILESFKTQTELLRSIDRKLSLQLELIGSQSRRGSDQGRQRRGGAPPPTVQGAWKFCESTSPHQSCGKLKDDSGLILLGEWIHSNDHPGSPCHQSGLGYGHCPKWGNNLRSHLVELAFENANQLSLKSGVYSLKIRYTCGEPTCALRRTFIDPPPVAAIIVGEIEFNNEGFVNAEGADWDRMLVNQRQTQLPYSNNARGVPTWLRRKISETWQNNDELKFLIDTNENTIVFQRNNMPKKTFWNVLAFTNNRKFPEFLRVYAFCGSCNFEPLDLALAIIP